MSLNKDFHYPETREELLARGVYSEPSLNQFKADEVEILFQLVSIITKLHKIDHIDNYVSNAKELATLLCPKCK